MFHFALWKYLLVGLANTLFGLTIIYAAKLAGDVDDVTANVMGYGIGILVSFGLNKRWTFGYEGPAYSAFARFIGVIAIAYVLNLLTVLAALKLEANAYLAQALGVFPYTAFSYIFARRFAFAKSCGK